MKSYEETSRCYPADTQVVVLCMPRTLMMPSMTTMEERRCWPFHAAAIDNCAAVVAAVAVVPRFEGADDCNMY